MDHAKQTKPQSPSAIERLEADYLRRKAQKRPIPFSIEQAYRRVLERRRHTPHTPH